MEECIILSVEFPIAAKSVDAFRYIVGTEQLITNGKTQYKAKITNTESFVKGDNVSYMIDYTTMSSGADGAFSKGSIYIRGVRQNGFDSFKFVLEKNNDFCPLDA